MAGPPLQYVLRRVDRSLLPTILGASGAPDALGAPRALGALGSLVLFVGPATAQGDLTNPTTGTEFSPIVQLLTTAVTGLVIGGLLLALAPDYTERTTDRILESPGETLVYGIGIGLATIAVVVLLAITVVGILLVIPIAIALAVVGVLGYLAIGRALVENWGLVLLVALVVYTICGIVPIFGTLVGLGISSAGIGAAYLEYTSDVG